jgi:thymidylate synthase (FAD)
LKYKVIKKMMQVTLLDHMGSDLNIVNAARCSFGKKKEIMDKSDEKLIAYLAKHGHWTPFAHNSIQFHIKAPMFVARQLGKHQVGLVWNEISRRYVDTDPEFYNPDIWRLKAENVKQGSSEETVTCDITEYNTSCLNFYNELLSKNIAPEMARMILPQNIMIEFHWTGSLYAFIRICKLRLAKDTQWETRQIAKLISDECKKLFPIAWNAFFPET